MPFIHFKDRDNKPKRLGGQMPFILYWHKRGGDRFYPVGRWENKDFSPKDSISRNDVVQFKFDAEGDIDESLTGWFGEGPPLLFRVGSGAWSRPVQRKGNYHYFSATGSSNSMRRVKQIKVYDEEIRFALRMDIAGAGDSWIADEEYTGSIRMRDTTERRAYLVAVRHGITFDDPFGNAQTFRPRSWADLVG
ncbi:hypothetical protein [Streptomyces sp. MST-110588]|uniref:hypothetical protein n=1 Tax=Streptomyces sp. MST-110588 TaxID=2833628 RepID=UPI001F5E0E5C|nr:hypothetical protein [Streptomyces sp. MST-110588]UNO43443.1 hypothetical protein KGS77_33140 [Streptomyces sp. MST-110588]